MVSWLSNRTYSRSLTTAVLLLFISSLFWLMIQPIAEMTPGSHHIEIQAEHPDMASAEKTNIEITSELENLLISMPQVKSVYSRTTAGVATVTVELHDYKSAGNFQAALRRKIHLYKSRFPVGFSSPQVIQRSVPGTLSIPDELLAVPRKLDSLNHEFSRNGIKIIPAVSTSATAVPAADYRGFTRSALSYPTQVSLGGEKISIADSGLYADSLVRFRSRTSAVLPAHRSADFIRNGVAYHTIQYSGDNRKYANRLNADTPVLLHHVSAIRVWLVVFLVYGFLMVLLGKCDLFFSGISLALILLFLFLYIRSSLLSHRTLILALLFLTPALFSIRRNTRLPEPGIMYVIFAFVIPIALCRPHLNIQKEDYHAGYDSEKILEASVFIHSGTLRRDMRQLQAAICESMSGNGIHYEMEVAHARSFRIKTPDTPISRKVLTSLALNSAGTYWFMHSDSKTILSTLKSPIYPSVQWTISSHDLQILRQTGDSIKRMLRHTPNIHKIRDISIVPDFLRNLTHEYFVRDHLPKKAFDQHLEWMEPGPRGHFQELMSLQPTVRLDSLLISATSFQSEILKKDRQYYLKFGHEYSGSEKSERRFRQRFKAIIQDRFGTHISINPCRPANGSNRGKIIATLTITMFLTYILSSIRGRGLADLGHQATVTVIFLLIHAMLDIKMWEPQAFTLMILLLNYLINLCFSSNLRNAIIWTILIVIAGCFVPIAPIVAGQCVLTIGSIITHPVLKSASKEFLPLPPWNDLRSFRRN